MKNYSITPIFQDHTNPIGEIACGPTCLYMAAKYFLPADQFAKNFGDYDSFIYKFYYQADGTYMPQIGLAALKNGLTAEIITANPYIFTHHDIGCSNINQQLNFSKNKYKNRYTKQILKWFELFQDAGGKITVAIPNKRHITDTIDNDKICMANFNSRFLMGKTGVSSHLCLVNGYEDNQLFITDPSNYARMDNFKTTDNQSLTGCYKFNADDFLYAMHMENPLYIDCGSLLVVGKSNPTTPTQT